MVDFDDALEEIGEFGKFQIFNYLLLCLPLFFSAGNSLTYVFTAGTPEYRCFVEGCDDEFSPTYRTPWMENAIPRDTTEDKKFERCTRYLPSPNLTPGVCSSDDFVTNATIRCQRWVYEDDEKTILNQWNITCDENKWKLSLVGTMHFIGITLGTILFGYLADKYGRKNVFVFCIIFMSITGIAQGLCDDYITFQVFVFLNAVGTSGVYPLAFILGVELVGKKKREMSGVVLNYFYAMGEAIIGLIAWLSKDWIIIQLAVSVPPILFIFYYWLVPESVRWLLAKKKTEQAATIMKRAAKMNGVQLSEKLLASIERHTDELGSSEKNKVEETSLWQAIKELLRSKTLCIRTLILYYSWAANAFVYYGLSVNSTTLGGDKYLNFALVCLVEIPGYTISWLLMNKLGRRWSFLGSLVFCGVTCIGAAFVPDDQNWAQVTLFLLGKLGITSSFGIAYVYTAELYPTVMRSVGVGSCSMMGRFGAIVAPFAPLLKDISKPLPMMMFSGVALLAGLLSFFLPETLGSRLPDTVAEAESFKLMGSRRKNAAASKQVGSDRESDSNS